MVDKFVKEYGTFICAGADPEETKKFVEAENVKKADDVVGKASRWVMEILHENNAIEL